MYTVLTIIGISGAPAASEPKADCLGGVCHGEPGPIATTTVNIAGDPMTREVKTCGGKVVEITVSQGLTTTEDAAAHFRQVFPGMKIVAVGSKPTFDRVEKERLVALVGGLKELGWEGVQVPTEYSTPADTTPYSVGGAFYFHRNIRATRDFWVAEHEGAGVSFTHIRLTSSVLGSEDLCEAEHLKGL